MKREKKVYANKYSFIAEKRLLVSMNSASPCTLHIKWIWDLAVEVCAIHLRMRLGPPYERPRHLHSKLGISHLCHTSAGICHLISKPFGTIGFLLNQLASRCGKTEGVGSFQCTSFPMGIMDSSATMSMPPIFGRLTRLGKTMLPRSKWSDQINVVLLFS